MASVFPFAAVIGQEKVKNALLWNLVNPKIGGVLISGEKGTAKSTLVRGLRELAGSMKVIDLPLNITEDRLSGSLDIEYALKEARRVFDPGLLYEADGNILYADEVNLLSDYIVNTLLETAGSGISHVEREGISFSHESRFILIGSMNPEEGRLRNHFLDRFGLYTDVQGEKDLSLRTEIMRRRIIFEKDPAGFIKSFEEQTEKLREKISSAKKNLADVRINENAVRLASGMAADVRSEGHRGEIALIETARAIAAMESRTQITVSDIRTASEYALSHRAVNFDPGIKKEITPQEEKDLSSMPDERENKEENREENREGQSPREEPSGHEEDSENASDDELRDENSSDFPAAPAEYEGESSSGSEDEEVQKTGEVFQLPRWQEPKKQKKISIGNGRRSTVISSDSQGRYTAYRMSSGRHVHDIAFDATFRAAAPYQKLRAGNGLAVNIQKSDIRVKIREKRTGAYILFVVDASASMGANKRMSEVKAAILSMLNVSYQKRDKVGLIAFRNDEASLLLDMTRSVDLAQKKLEQLPCGGKTPLAAGLDLAYEILMGLRLKDSEAVPTLVLVTDGRASGSRNSGDPFEAALLSAQRIGRRGINTIILDTENDFIRLSLCIRLNEKLNGTHITMEEMKAEGIIEAVSQFKK